MSALTLVTASGRDTPGITSGLTGVLAQHAIGVRDIAQAVIHDLLSLSILYEAPDSTQAAAAERDLRAEAARLGLALEFRSLSGSPEETASRRRYAVTLIADCVSARALHEVTALLAARGANIDVIHRLSEADFGCVEMLVSSNAELDLGKLKKDLLDVARAAGVDLAIQAEGLYRRAKRLIVLDMDSTLIQSEVIDELARERGVYDEVAAITHEAMAGKIDYDESLRRRCAKLAGLPAAALEQVFARIQLTPGADDLIRALKQLGYRIALISGGFSFVADRLRERLGIDYAYANKLEIEAGKVSGKVSAPIVNAQRKADLLEAIAQQERIALDQVIAVGDGANDLMMLEKAGLGIAFNAKPLVREQADLALNRRNLRAILYLLGLSARDLAEAGLSGF